MAINACTLNGFTIDGRFCRDKFAALIPILHPPVSTAVVGNPRVLRDTFVQQLPQFEYEDRPLLNFEQPFITVTVELEGATFSQQLDNGPQSHFVTVTDLSIAAADRAEVDEELVTVNISDLRI